MLAEKTSDKTSLDIIDSYNESGFYIAKNLFDKDKISKALHDIQQLFILQAEKYGIRTRGFKDNSTLLNDMKAVFDNSLDSYLAAARLTGCLVSVNDIMTGAEVSGVMKQLGMELPVIRTLSYLNIMSEDLKIPNGYFGVTAHQDWPSMQGSLDAITVWVPLMDVDKDMYPLEIIPGSHKYGLLGGKIVSNTLEVDKSNYNEEDFVPVEVEAGDAIFFSAFLLHRSGLTGRKKCVRMGCSIRYENAKESSFIERNFPTAYKRTVERDFITPDFPSKEQVVKIFNK